MSQTQQSITVVIPTLNEAQRIGTRLRELHAAGFDDVIVVDGGSTDSTRSIVADFPWVRLVSSAQGRARQMNCGARLSEADVVLFLHADVALPQDSAGWIADALAQPHVVAGAFRTHTVDDAGQSRLQPFLRLADLRSSYTSLPHGDQAVFVRREAFWRVGGFPDVPIMEDLELSRRLSAVGEIVTVPGRARVRVSGRRFIARPLYYLAVMNVFPLLRGLGVPAHTLAALYGEPR